MSNIYDNWERLVAAVTRKEKDRQLAYCESFSSSFSSPQSDSNPGDELQMRIDATYRNTNDALPVVQAWLDESKSNQVKTSAIEVESRNTPSGCFAIKSRYSLSKKAKKTADATKDLREKCKFEEIFVPAPPASRAPITQGPSDEFESRKHIEEKIMEDLRGGNIHMMGICGMGGVGKTTMAKRIMIKAREENLFDEVVMAVVSQPVDQRKIQGEIAEWLGLKLEEDSVSTRAYKLCYRLKGGKSILLILDDVWEGLNLEELGIPCKSDVGGGCTIVLTSRNKDVLNKMDAEPYAMEILAEEEAWFLFRENVGTCLDDSDLISIAKEVAKECKGLPLALTIVGTTLINEKRKTFWEDALVQLKSANPITMPDVLNEVYKPLKLSYVSLKNQHVRSLFLLCCIFPEDWNINLDDLTMYGIGLRLFEGMSVQEAKNRVRTLLEMLKDRSLLLDGHDENHVKMHDVFRDVATFIASEEGLVGRNLSNCKWISVIGEQINKLPNDLSFPSLRLFVMGYFTNTNWLRLNLEEISMRSFFLGKEELNVLHLSALLFRSLPETTQLLKNLRTLYLNQCDSLEIISIVGELLNLEILICRECSRIKELPAEIGNLKRLKLLEVSECRSLIRIAPGVISKLVQLEELIIVGSFARWERKANGEQRDNVLDRHA